jgi:hypothetical protein
MRDRRLNEATERLYDRARKSGADHSEAAARVERARVDVSRRIESGAIQYPPPRKE